MTGVGPSPAGAIQSRWSAACAATIGTEDFWRLAVDHRAARAALAPMIDRYVRGDVLDAGAGRLAWSMFLKPRASRYVALDRFPEHRELSLVGDIVSGLPIRSAALDSIFCCSVLEHVTDARAAMREFQRILKPGGHLVLSVPFLYYLHGAPHDFFRFTRYGVELLARECELEMVVLEDSGGVAHQLLHAVSMVGAALLHRLPGGMTMTAWLSACLWRLARLIDRLDGGRRFAQNINAVLRKPSS